MKNQNTELAGLFDGPLSPLRPRQPQASDVAHPATAQVCNSTPASNQIPALKNSPSLHEQSELKPVAIEEDDPKPPASKAVLARYRKFITAFVKAPHDPGAAYMAAYRDSSRTSAEKNASRLMADEWVAAQIDVRMRKALEKSQVSIDEIVCGIKQITKFDVRCLYKRDRETGKWRQREPWELDTATAMAIESLQIEELPAGRRKTKYKSAGKVSAYELLAKYKGMLKEPERPPIVANIQINF